MINRGYFSKKVKELYSVFLRTLRKLSNYKYKHRSISIKKKPHQFNAVIYNVMFPDKVKRMKRRKKEIRK